MILKRKIVKVEFLSSVIFFASNNFLLPSLEKEIWQQNIANHLIQKQNIYTFVQKLYIISNFFLDIFTFNTRLINIFRMVRSKLNVQPCYKMST